MANAVEPVRLALRKLWSDHVIWTREYILAAISDLDGAGAAAGRLLRNQEDIGNAIVPFYGDAAGTKLTELLKQHIMIAVDLVADAKAGDNTKFAQDDQRWTDNITEIAGFLARANPHWPQKDVFDLLALHLQLTKTETTQILQRDFEGAIKTFDDIFNEIIVLADALYDGLVAQFPDKIAGKAPVGVPA